jgi:hypothetical protein
VTVLSSNFHFSITYFLGVLTIAGGSGLTFVGSGQAQASCFELGFLRGLENIIK